MPPRNSDESSPELIGWLPVWKPVGVTSHDLIRWMKHALYGTKPRPKLGHTGTLDPFAEGLVLIAVGRATRLIPLLEHWDKTYEATCALGTLTDTLDPTGTVIEEAEVPILDPLQVRGALARWTGDVWQQPPIYSALKQGGEALYKKARRGEAVETPPRLVNIYAIELLNSGADALELAITCGSGTYIRSLCRDIALELGTVGHCSALVRTALGPIGADDAWRLDGPEECTREEILAHVREPDWALEPLPFVSLSCAETPEFCRGMRFQAETIIDESHTGGLNQPLRIYSAEGRFLGVGRQVTREAPLLVQPEMVLVNPEEL